MKNSPHKPCRRDDVLSKSVQDELIVYDLSQFQSHCLESSVAAIWEMCDGHTTVAEMAQRLQVSEDVVGLGLRRLEKIGLMNSPRVAWTLSLSRRELGVQAAALGGLAVLSALLPTPAEAGSKSASCSKPCYTANACKATGYCVGGPVCCCQYKSFVNPYCALQKNCVVTSKGLPFGKCL
jgi:hypothetical protein